MSTSMLEHDQTRQKAASQRPHDEGDGARPSGYEPAKWQGGKAMSAAAGVPGLTERETLNRKPDP